MPNLPGTSLVCRDGGGRSYVIQMLGKGSSESGVSWAVGHDLQRQDKRTRGDRIAGQGAGRHD